MLKINVFALLALFLLHISTMSEGYMRNTRYAKFRQNNLLSFRCYHYANQKFNASTPEEKELECLTKKINSLARCSSRSWLCGMQVHILTSNLLVLVKKNPKLMKSIKGGPFKCSLHVLCTLRDDFLSSYCKGGTSFLFPISYNEGGQFSCQKNAFSKEFPFIQSADSGRFKFTNCFSRWKPKENKGLEAIRLKLSKRRRYRKDFGNLPTSTGSAVTVKTKPTQPPSPDRTTKLDVTSSVASTDKSKSETLVLVKRIPPNEKKESSAQEMTTKLSQPPLPNKTPTS